MRFRNAPLAEPARSASPLAPCRDDPPMGCRVEAAFRARGGLVVRELRVFRGSALAAESLMAFAA